MLKVINTLITVLLSRSVYGFSAHTFTFSPVVVIGDESDNRCLPPERWQSSAMCSKKRRDNNSFIDGNICIRGINISNLQGPSASSRSKNQGLCYRP